MDLQTYVVLVALAAIAYSSLTRYIQGKLVNRKEMEGMQKESKALSEAYKKAAEKKDKAEMDRIMKEQMEFLPKMNKMMLAQFKPMIVIIVLFAGFMYAVNYFNPMTSDDVTMILKDDGNGCDASAGDGIFSGCYEISGTNYGKWTYTATALNDGSQLGLNQTYFFYAREDADTYVEKGTGQPVVPGTDKMFYADGETVRLYAAAPSGTTEVKAALDSGTWFYSDLPFVLPLFNVQRIYQPYWWFILISVVSGLLISFILGRIKK
ncbi:DUF106 domain-containing protein [Candidatus Micrarchaeota archaeon]|nr:DUF106 domain-containing protein [Candidatus Micrarchaeota archaeon]